MGVHPARCAVAAHRGAGDPRRDARFAHRREAARHDAGRSGTAARHRRHARSRTASAHKRARAVDLIRNEAELREIYARWLDFATKAGFAISLVAFLVYVTGLVPAFLPPSELPRYWMLPVDRFVAATGTPQQWAWLHFLRYGDVLNVGAVALLALVTPVCYTRLLPKLLAQRDWLQLALACAQILVLVVAA